MHDTLIRAPLVFQHQCGMAALSFKLIESTQSRKMKVKHAMHCQVSTSDCFVQWATVKTEKGVVTMIGWEKSLRIRELGV